MNGGGGGRGGGGGGERERDGDVGPSPPPATNSGGQFLLQLLQKPQQSQTHEPSPTPPPSNNNNPNSVSSTYHPHHHPDPAVAAVGPSVPYPPWPPSNGHDPHPPPWSAPPSNSPFPHNFLLPGFPSNPWSPPGGFPPPPSSHFPVNPPVLPHELYRLGLLGNNTATGNPGHHHLPQQQEQQKHHLPQQQQQQQQQQESMLMFGSLACDLRKNQEGLLNRNSLDPHSRGVDRVNANTQIGVQKDREVLGFNANTNGMLRGESDHRMSLDRTHQGSHHLHDHQGRGGGGDGWVRGFQRSPMPEPRRAPPGFPQKPKSLGQLGAMSGRSEFDHNVGYPGEFDRSEYHQIQGDLSSRLGLSGQVDHPGPPSGSNLHSIPAMDIEESLSKMHREAVEEGNPGLVAKRKENKSRDGHSHRRGGEREQDDLEAHFMSSMVLRDGVDNTNGMRQQNSSHDKDFKRLWTPPQRIRNHRRELECRSDIDRLNAPFLAVYESLVPAEEEKAKQKQLLTSLEKLVNKEWPSALLYLYGSCANSFGVSKSDIDVCLAIEEKDITKSEILLKLAELLESDNLKNVQALTRARVPIVKLMDPVTGISCDICINNVLAVVNTKLLRDYAQIDVRLRQLAFIVKHWAKSRGVNETYRGTLSSYAYVLMCIHFLQQRKPAILPCLQEMETTYAVTVDGIECAFFDKVENLRNFGARNKENIGQLVWGFFDYWAHRHDYANSVISVRTGGMISKRAKDWTRRIGNDRHLICIEDPFQISHDLGRVVDKFSIKVLREEFERAANVMQYDPDPCVTLFEPYVPR